MGKNTQPKELWCTVHDEIISANSIKELNEKFAALGIDENATVGIGAKVVAISTRTTNPKPTIRRLRREVRRLRSLLKTKDRLIASQKSFYEAMLDDVQKREGTSKESVEEWFKKMLLRTIKSLETTYGIEDQGHLYARQMRNRRTFCAGDKRMSNQIKTEKNGKLV